MSWTDEDTRTLRAQGRCLDCAVDPSVVHDHSAELEQRAADEIRRLQARVAELEVELVGRPTPGAPVWLPTNKQRLLWHAEHLEDLAGSENVSLDMAARAAIVFDAELVRGAVVLIDALEAERAEVARELRKLAHYQDADRTATHYIGSDLAALATRLERKGE